MRLATPALLKMDNCYLTSFHISRKTNYLIVFTLNESSPAFGAFAVTVEMD